MEYQTKILISVFSGFIGIGVVIGLSILGWKKKEKNKRNEVWNEWQKKTLLKDKVREINGQLNGMCVTFDEISKQVNELKADSNKRDFRDQKRNEILNRLVAKDAERDELEAKKRNRRS